MTWNSVMGLVSSVALFLPIVLILLFRLASYKTFPVLLVYFSTVFFYNLASLHYLSVPTDIIMTWSICNNFLDAPLLLYFLTYFSTSPSLTKKMKWLIAGILIFQSAVLIIVGFNNAAVTIFLGPALLCVFAFCLHFFVQRTKISIKHHKAAGKAIITASLLFAYGCYTIIYLMYYVFKTPYIDDTFLVYFLVVTLSSLLLSVGLFAERKRIGKLHELLQTRKELSVIYQNEAKPIPTLRKVALDFDKDPWV